MVPFQEELRHVLFQAALAVACHNPVLKTVAKRVKEHGRPQKVDIIAIARRLITIANAIFKTGEAWGIRQDDRHTRVQNKASANPCLSIQGRFSRK